MKKRINEYINRTDELIEDDSNRDWNAVIAEHLVQISFFQHERLIHLIVTVTFAVLELLAILITVNAPSVGTLALCAAVLVLLIPYIKHYYFLENRVQYMYDQYDKMRAKNGDTF